MDCHLAGTQQSACSQPDCQTVGKAEYHQSKRLHDPVYAQTCQNIQKNWLRDHPDYYQHYR